MPSFDIVSKTNLPEVGQRFDFKEPKKSSSYTPRVATAGNGQDAIDRAYDFGQNSGNSTIETLRR